MKTTNHASTPSELGKAPAPVYYRTLTDAELNTYLQVCDAWVSPDAEKLEGTNARVRESESKVKDLQSELDKNRRYHELLPAYLAHWNDRTDQVIAELGLTVGQAREEAHQILAPIEAAKESLRRARNDQEDAIEDDRLLLDEAQFVAAEQFGFLLGIRAMATIQTNPEAFGYTKELAPSIVARLMDDRQFRQEFIATMVNG